MIGPQPSDRVGSRQAFLVERYLSPAAGRILAASTARVQRLCSDSAFPGSVRYLYSAYLPTEDTCLCLFEAASSDAVLAVNQQARFAVDRVTEATLLVSLPQPDSLRP